MDHEKYLIALLERRDARPPVSDREPEVEADLERLNRVRDDLRSISEVHPPAYVWQNIAAKLDNRQRPTFVQNNKWLLAMAASVFLAALLSFSRLPGFETENLDPGMRLANLNDTATAPENELYALIAESQSLERSMKNTSRGYFVNTGTRAALLQRISDIDARIGQLTYAITPYSPELKQLWQQRVNLLRSMIAMEQTQTGIPAKYTL